MKKWVILLLVLLAISLVSSQGYLSPSEQTEVKVSVGSEQIQDGSGGGGGGSRISSEDIIIDKKLIKISLKQGETKRESFIITNQGSKKTELTIDFSLIEDFIKLDEKEFTINPGESKVINIDFIARETTEPDIYIGKIRISGYGIEEEIIAAIDVESRISIFDVSVEIPNEFTEISPGDELVAIVKIFNLGETGRIYANVEYIIKNQNDEIIISQTETIAVETQVNLIKKFKIPEDVKLGVYVIYIKTSHQGNTAGASSFFTVSRKINIWFYITIILIIMLILIPLSIIIKNKNIKQIKKLLK